MNTLNPRARLMIPDGLSAPDALRRTTHLGIGAHQDDLEFMAFHGILACHDRSDRWFGGVTITDGRGSSRVGKFKDWTDDQIAAERIREQDAAAVIGQYSFMAQLGYPSAFVRDARDASVRGDLLRILEATRPEVVYLHNLADKHDTHVGCALRCIEALRLLPKANRPKKAYGCEVWRDLDWLVDEDKTPMPVSQRPELARALNEVFATQIAGGKRYDLAVIGRRTANATFSQAHATDQETAMQWAMDLTPLVQDDSLDPIAYVTGFIDRLKADVTARLRQSL
jgi:LmbE family N-acetylglucosaminyl deacetylase